jgi:hypothetical protein
MEYGTWKLCLYSGTDDISYLMHSQLQPVSGDRFLHQKPKDAPTHGYKGLVKHDHSVGRVSCCWPPPAQLFLVPGLTGPTTIFFCLTSVTVNMSDNFTANGLITDRSCVKFCAVRKFQSFRDSDTLLNYGSIS